MSSSKKPGWVNVPGKGRRYWTGSEFRMHGPSDDATHGGRTAWSGDIAGYWNNMVNYWGRSTGNSSEVGQQTWTREQVQQARSNRDGDSEPTATLSPTRPAPLPTNYTGSDGTEYDVKTGRPVDAPEGGYSLEEGGTMTPHSEQDLETETTETPAPAPEGGDEKSTTRTNGNGIVQKGMNLGGIQNFLNFNPDLKLADGADYFNFSGKKTDTEKPYKTGEHTISGKDTGYEISGESAPIHKLGDTKGAKVTMPKGNAGGYEMPAATVPLTTGHSKEDPQAGVSDAPDNADNSRGISFNTGRRGRKDPRNRGNGADTPFGGVEPSDSSLTSPMYKDKARNKYRSTFLDSTAKGPMGVLRESAASVGVIRTNDGKVAVKDGDNYRTYTGDASAREVAFDLGGGQSGWDKHSAGFEMVKGAEKPGDSKATSDDEQTPATIQPAPQQSGVKPGTIKPQENTGGSFESPTPITKPDTSKIDEATSFMNNFRSSLTKK